MPELNWGSEGGMGSRDTTQLKQLVQSVCPPARLIGELGCWTGAGTRVLSEAAGPHATVVSVDWFHGNEGTVIGAWAAAGNDVLSYWRANTADLKNVICVIAESGRAATTLAYGQFDLFFIDADHRYANVHRDLALWEPAVRPGGILCGHDFERPAEECTVEELAQEDVDYLKGPNIHPGVIRAVTERYGSRVNYGNRLWWVEVGA